jgi:hypothetical protein
MMETLFVLVLGAAAPRGERIHPGVLKYSNEIKR